MSNTEIIETIICVWCGVATYFFFRDLLFGIFKNRNERWKV